MMLFRQSCAEMEVTLHCPGHWRGEQLAPNPLGPVHQSVFSTLFYPFLSNHFLAWLAFRLVLSPLLPCCNQHGRQRAAWTAMFLFILPSSERRIDLNQARFNLRPGRKLGSLNYSYPNCLTLGFKCNATWNEASRRQTLFYLLTSMPACVCPYCKANQILLQQKEKLAIKSLFLKILHQRLYELAKKIKGNLSR